MNDYMRYAIYFFGVVGTAPTFEKALEVARLQVTPQQQGSECIYQAQCKFYMYGIWCNECTQRVDFDEVDESWDDCEDVLDWFELV